MMVLGLLLSFQMVQRKLQMESAVKLRIRYLKDSFLLFTSKFISSSLVTQIIYQNSGLTGVGGSIEFSALPQNIQERRSDYDLWREWLFRMLHVLTTPRRITSASYNEARPFYPVVVYI